MDLMIARRRLLSIPHSNDLYPIGTDVITMYIGRDESGYGNFITGKSLDTHGEIIDGTGNAASPVYIPVKDTYLFRKNGNRLYNLSFYNSAQEFIGYVIHNDRAETDLNPFPAGTAYIRIATHSTAKQNWLLTITRIA